MIPQWHRDDTLHVWNRSETVAICHIASRAHPEAHPLEFVLRPSDKAEIVDPLEDAEIVCRLATKGTP